MNAHEEPLVDTVVRQTGRSQPVHRLGLLLGSPLEFEQAATQMGEMLRIVEVLRFSVCRVHSQFAQIQVDKADSRHKKRSFGIGNKTAELVRGATTRHEWMDVHPVC